MNKKELLAKLNKRIDALIIKQASQGFLSDQDLEIYKRLTKLHKRILYM